MSSLSVRTARRHNEACLTFEVFEIPNTFTPDFPLSKQIELGINDWQVEDSKGRVAFGHSKKEAVANYKETVANRY